MIKSAFAELTIATRALTTAQSNIQVNAHNISNAATKGYSRQYTVQSATKPFASGSVGMWGTGSDVTSVNQIRSVFLDVQFRSKTSILGQYTIKNEQLNITEVTFSALGDSGLTTQIDDFFDTLEELSKEPQSLTTRNNTITSAVSMAEQVSTIGKQLQEQQTSINQEVKTVVDTVNSIGQQIVSLNNQIKIYEMNGSNANDLRDQRNLLVDELSQYVNVKTTEVETNKEYDANDPNSGLSVKEFKVQINGYTFIDNDFIDELQCVKRDATTKVNEMDANGLYDIQFKLTKQEFDIYSDTLTGELKGLIDTRDGNNNTNTMYYDAILGKAVMAGTETAMPTAPDATDTTKYPGGEIDPDYLADYESYLSDLSKYADVDRSNYTTDADFIAAVESGVRGSDATGPLTTSTYKGLPHYMNKLNNFIRTLALSVNEGKTFDTSSGYGKNAEKVDIDGTNNGLINYYDLEGNEGELLFTYQQYGVYQNSGEIEDYTNINFNNFYVNPNLVDDPSMLAISDSATDGESNANGVLWLIDLKTDSDIFKEGTYQDYLIAMTGELAIAKNQAQNFTDNYSEVVTLTENQRQSVMGVDTNEELVYLTRNQQLYEAAAKLISTINEIYATCVNLGR